MAILKGDQVLGMNEVHCIYSTAKYFERIPPSSIIVQNVSVKRVTYPAVALNLRCQFIVLVAVVSYVTRAVPKEPGHDQELPSNKSASHPTLTSLLHPLHSSAINLQ